MSKLSSSPQKLDPLAKATTAPECEAGIVFADQMRELNDGKIDHHSDGMRCSHSHPHGQTDNARLSPAPAFSEDTYYASQLPLPELGGQGQERLRQSRVLVVGAGGLGCPVLTALTQAGIGAIGVCDDGTVKATDLHRQPLYSVEDIGKGKAVTAARRLQGLNPFTKILVHSSRLATNNAEDLMSHYDLIIDGTNNFETKLLLNDASFLARKPLIQASVYQWDGRLTYLRPDDHETCLRCLWPQVPPQDCPADGPGAGILGVVPGLIGQTMALEAIKFILGLPVLPINQTLHFDLRTGHMTKIKRKTDPDCPLCGANPSIKSIKPSPKNEFQLPAGMDISIQDIPKDRLEEFTFIDVREPPELQKLPLPNLPAIHLPLSRFPHWDHTFTPEKKYLFFCEAGMRSHRVVEELRNKGHHNVYSIIGGRPAITRHLA